MERTGRVFTDWAAPEVMNICALNLHEIKAFYKDTYLIAQAPLLDRSYEPSSEASIEDVALGSACGGAGSCRPRGVFVRIAAL